MSDLTAYLQAVRQNLGAGNATEHTHRPALKETIRLMVEIDAAIPAWPME
ncbi:MAG: hypothetical protein JW934_07960 [Anaerolineae bacterium]|nr:hypothetical protein [Anaerolineae bacterium]